MNNPLGLALDATGNLLIADGTNHRIRRVDVATGIITTVAGNGTGLFSGDGGLATSASLRGPRGLALDAAGNLFIADRGNHRIRRVDAITRRITTVSGDGTPGIGGDGGLATSANLTLPSGVALDAAGNILIADASSDRIRRVDAISGLITTVAGSDTGGFSGDGGLATSARLSFPTGVALDAVGNFLIADFDNHRIRRVDAASGLISTVAGDGCRISGPKGWVYGCFRGDDGLATSASLAYPSGVALGEVGDLFIADRENNRIRRVSADDGTISTVAGDGCRNNFGPFIRGCFGGDGGPATSASLNLPSGVALDAAGNLLIADSSNHRIRQVGDAVAAMPIEIDIKPNSIPNSINPSDRGLIPVAILGSDIFDVSEINGASLTFAERAAAPAHDLADPMAFADHLENVNGDGWTDLVSHYLTEAAGIAYGDMTACLTGSTLDGVRFNGCDAVRTVPDMDGDRLLDVDEQAAGTNAFCRDTDNDGYDDGTEVLTLGTNPLDALDPAPAPAGEKERKRQRNRRR